MAQTLGIASIGSDTVNGTNRQLLASLHQPILQRGFIYRLYRRRKRRKTWLSIANAALNREDFSVNRDFIVLNEDSYGTENQKLDFMGDPQSATDEINAR